MPEYLHTNKAPYAAAEYGKQKQGGLGDSPLVAPGFAFIDPKSSKPGKIDSNKIYCNV